ncbi:MAG: GAF domain-containing protein [Acidobacteria bacterium]|nr:GAF domain-containing protein [Acidobacteriota bacterium]
MSEAKLPPNENERLAELRRLGILDTTPEKAFDDLTFLASQICQTPVALVSLVDEERQWFKSRVGLELTETPRDQAFCAYAIHDSSMMVVSDTHEDPRFRDNPLVMGDPYVRFYAGVPLSVRSGLNIGTLCVLDSRPRDLSSSQRLALEALGRQVRRVLEYRQFSYVAETFLAYSPLFVALKESSGRYEFVNAAWRNALEAHGDPIGKTSAEWVSDDPSAAEADRIDLETLRNGRAELSTVSDAFGLQNRKWIVNRFPVAMLSGQPGIGIVGVDVTETIRAEERLGEAERRLEHAARVQSIGMVASTVAHEFNNALMGIAPNAELLHRMAEEGSKQKKAATAILASVKQTKGLIQQILRYGRPAEPLLHEIDLRQWLIESVPLLQSLAGPTIDIQLEVPEREMMVRVDHDQLHQILANLVSNSRDAMGGSGQVVLRLNDEQTAARLSVSDSGAGIPPEHVQKIFEPLFTTKRLGTGLGLAVARQMIESHGGSLEVASELGKGATFHLRLPLISDIAAG